MSIRSRSVSLVVDPLAFIHIAICVVKLALAIGLAVAPLTVVAATIEPFLLSMAVTYAIEPFSFVDGSTIEIDGWP